MLTGESMPVRKDIGAAVVGGSIKRSGAFVYAAYEVGSRTALAQIIKLVRDARNSKAPAQLLADRAPQCQVLASVVVALATITAWFRRMGQPVLLGNRLLMHANGVDLSALAADAERLTGAGRTVIFAAVGGSLAGLLAIADAVRATSRAAIDELHRRGVKVAMIAGDNRPTAEPVARDLGIDIVLADVLPGAKADEVKKLQAQGRRVGMVGDGVNDAPAPTGADVGFAIGAGTDVAAESADVVLMRSDPFDVVRAITIARATRRRMHQNLAWAAGYDALAFPLAAGVAYPLMLSPEMAALSMSGGSVIGALNALMLRRVRLEARTSPPRGQEAVA